MMLLEGLHRFDHMINECLDVMVKENEKRGGAWLLMVIKEDGESNEVFEFASLGEALQAGTLTAGLLGYTCCVYVCLDGEHRILHTYEPVFDSREVSENHM